jgi:hypothetical protein
MQNFAHYSETGEIYGGKRRFHRFSRIGRKHQERIYQPVSELVQEQIAVASVSKRKTLIVAHWLRFNTFALKLNLSGMKFQSLFFVAALGAITLFSDCQSDAPASAKTTAENAGTLPSTDQTAVPPAAAPTDVPPVATAPTTVPGATLPNPVSVPNPTAVPTPNAAKKPEPAQNAKGVWHYTCPKGCAGGAGAAQACAKCGTTLVHNTAYHENATPSVAANPVPGAANQPVAPPKPEPAQNAKGVWHYTCAAGCAGGAGAATACAKCGKTLVHNATYHQ